MQDRHLFRGKRLDNGEWVVGCHAETISGTAIIFKATINDDNAFVHHIINPATIGQCTGLKDKTGKLIFEGDIVKLCDTNPILFIVSIELKKYGWGCVFRYTDDNKIVNGAFLHSCEIIGNRHDNPNLLEGTN